MLNQHLNRCRCHRSGRWQLSTSLEKEFQVDSEKLHTAPLDKLARKTEKNPTHSRHQINRVYTEEEWEAVWHFLRDAMHYKSLLWKVNDLIDEGDQADTQFPKGCDRSFPDTCKEINQSERRKFPMCEWLQNKKQRNNREFLLWRKVFSIVPWKSMIGSLLFNSFVNYFVEKNNYWQQYLLRICNHSR